MLFKSRSEEIKKDISRAISIMWYVAKLYVKSIFAFWGIMFLLAIKAHKNPFVEFQGFSGNEFYAAKLNQHTVSKGRGQWVNYYFVCYGHQGIGKT